MILLAWPWGRRMKRFDVLDWLSIVCLVMSFGALTWAVFAFR
jgi:hypothetical protein